MTDSIEASDDDAIAGEQVAYVPCFGAAAAVDADDDSEAIDGRGEGYVADDTQAGDFADSDDGQAVYGSAVGFVAKPCSEDCTDSIIDDFTRTEVANAWGSTTPDSYGTWNTGTPSGTSSFSVNGTQAVAVGGHVTPLGFPAGTTAVLSGSFPAGSWPWEDGDFSVRVRFQFDANGTGSPFISFDFGNTSGYIHMYYQHGDGTVKFGIWRSGAGVGESTTFVAPVVDSMYAMEMEYKQSTGLHRGRMYLESGPVPDWQVSRDSSGDSPTESSGMRVAVEPASGSPDVTYLIEDITYNLCPVCVVTDDYNRTVASGLDTATPSGYVYSGSTSPVGSGWSVDGSRAVMVWPPPTNLTDEPFFDNPAGPWARAEWTFTTLFQVSAWSSLWNTSWRFNGQSLVAAIGSGGSRSRRIYLEPGINWPSSPTGLVEDDNGGSVAFEFDPNGTYYVKWHYVRAGGVSEVKVWASSDPEPGTWTLSTSAGSDDDPYDQFFPIGPLSGTGPSGAAYDSTHPAVSYFDYIDFDC